MITNRHFRMYFTNAAGQQLNTGVTVRVPRDLTDDEAIAYVTGKIAGEVSRYAAAEALGIVRDALAVDYKVEP